MYIFWASVFILPTRVLLDIEQLMRGFLWCQGGVSKGKAKVSWEVVCLPKDEGGLGVRRLDHFNKALMISHIWKLLSLKESLWVRWIHAYKLKGRSFWDIPYRGTMSWGWRKILQLRPLVREFFWHNIGDGSRVSLWFDRWCPNGPLYTIVSTRDMFRAGFSLSSTVRDAIRNGSCWDVAAGIGTSHLNQYARMRSVGSSMQSIISYLIPLAKRKMTRSVIGKIVVAATAYFVWHERNIRLFKGNKRSVQEIIECTMTSIRLKLLSCRLKKSNDGVLFAQL
ncbi:hypothetical protein Tco_1385666 [Tanacetum coccineum]